MKVKELKKILAHCPDEAYVQFEASFIDEDIRLVSQANLTFDELGNPIALRLG